jgi:hypothetical protein
MNGGASDDVWAITCYFNPVGYRSRLANYRVFRKHLPVPLVTVELSYDAGFHLRREDAEILIQLRGGDVLWQKERLLNVALGALPRGCRTVAWLDCDVVFQRSGWPSATDLALDEFTLIQPFGEAHHLGPDACPESSGATPPVYRPDSLARRMIDGTVPTSIFAGQGASQRWSYAVGLAWACRRETLEAGGLYDGLIMGSGDKAMAAAAYGYSEDAVRAYRMNRRQARHYRSWARPFFDAVRGRVGFVKGTLWHLWHGDRRYRNYGARYDGFADFEFDPYCDIAVSDDGCWRWSTAKDDLHEHVSRYFRARREDGAAPDAVAPATAIGSTLG